MPNLRVSLKREPSWSKETFREKLLQKAQLEKIKAGKPGCVQVWDASPIINDDPDNLELTWRYKQFKKS